MVDKEPDEGGPSLEMPSFGFGRKRKRADPEPDPEAETDTTAVEPVETPGPAPKTPSGTTPVERLETPEPAPKTPTGTTPVEPVETPEPAPEPTEVLATVPPAPVAPPLFADEAPAARPPAYAEDDAADEDDEPVEAAPRRSFALPAIGGSAASVVAGLVAGLLTVGLTWASLRLCEVLQGTSSCGNPGILLLVAILVVAIVAGGALLRAFGVPDGRSISFLGMGLVSVVTLLFLVELLFQWWMILVIPTVAMVAFALAHWVTTAFVEPVETNLHR